MEYGQALRFINQSAFVCDGINPIQLIDENGEIIQTLSKDIREVSLPDEIIKTLSMIRFREKPENMVISIKNDDNTHLPKLLNKYFNHLILYYGKFSTTTNPEI